jgi:hypothetical protein
MMYTIAQRLDMQTWKTVDAAGRTFLEDGEQNVPEQI